MTRGHVTLDDHGLAKRVTLPGVSLECRPDPKHPARPWMLRLSGGRHVRLDSVELDKLAWVLDKAVAL